MVGAIIADRIVESLAGIRARAAAGVTRSESRDTVNISESRLLNNPQTTADIEGRAQDGLPSLAAAEPGTPMASG